MYKLSICNITCKIWRQQCNNLNAANLYFQSYLYNVLSIMVYYDFKSYFLCTVLRNITPFSCCEILFLNFSRLPRKVMPLTRI